MPDLDRFQKILREWQVVEVDLAEKEDLKKHLLTDVWLTEKQLQALEDAANAADL